MWAPTGWQWLWFLLLVWVTYETIRYAIVAFAKNRYEWQVNKFLRAHDIPHDSFRHTHRVVVKEKVLNDPGLQEAMAARGREEDPVIVRQKVKDWLDEIVPQFNLLAYYKIGYTFGRWIAYSLYNVRLDKPSLQRAQAQIPAGASVVYVSNHRSNADFVVTGFMLSKSVQISYAVGEWARVWPLETLFKAFGSYFVRRGEKDPLYHRTLEAYLQLITKQGLTQAMFPEGGLTRDGGLRPVKLGLLDNMTKAKLDPSFDKPLVFVPVGINFDRVVEDENMVQEACGEGPVRRSLGQKVSRIFALGGKILVGWPVNVLRWATKRLKKHGVVAIHFGTPISFDEWYAKQTPFLQLSERHERWRHLQPFGELLLQGIGHNIPVTPATLACFAMRGHERLERGTFLLRMKEAETKLAAAGAPFATGPAPGPGPDEPGFLQDVGDEFDRAERRTAVLALALDVLAPRNIIVEEAGYLVAKNPDLIAYYARSLDSHLDTMAIETTMSNGTQKP